MFFVPRKNRYICSSVLSVKSLKAMGKKVKWALLTMLGFATACSTVKNAPQGEPQDQAPDSARVERQIRLMYGVRPPVPVEEVERQQAIREKTARKEAKKAQRVREKEAPASKNE
jgi:hypothetical protein